MFEWVGKNFNKSSEKAAPAEFGQGAGRSNEAVYRGEASPLGADPSQPIEFSLTPAESEEAQRGLLAAKEAAGRVDTERIEVIRDRIFGNQAEASMAVGENHIDTSDTLTVEEVKKPADDEEDGNTSVGLP